MSDKFNPTPLKQLLKIILNQIETSDNVLGINKKLFFKPNKNDKFRLKRFGKLLENPLGVAAGPHTQLSQNIVAAWLTGARYIELKTIQTLDELEISKPCIDMQDEGYNCEWSQELKIHQSYEQYLDAWILIWILKDKLNIGDKNEAGFIFNMSAGYDFEGMLKENVKWFFSKMNDASEELNRKINEIKNIYPNVENLNISSCISDNITLSTMHGCPPHEIEKIGKYLISEMKIHTTIKLNPTLLGKSKLQKIIKNSGFETEVPDIAFEHDLKYFDAVKIIKNLTKKAAENNVFFGLKLTNTLECINHKNKFPENEKMMYASGRILHPISINLAKKLQNDFNGKLNISFSGGADAFNISEILTSGIFPVTICSDLLKPGGYGRLYQYIENIKNSDIKLNEKSKLQNLNIYAENVLQNPKYKKENPHEPNIKTNRKLGFFDCSFAPCEDNCPTNQGIPSYMYYTAKGEFENAYNIITQTNSFPNSTGMVCDHICQTKCTRINYDNSLLIRDIKRFIVENHNKNVVLNSKSETIFSSRKDEIQDFQASKNIIDNPKISIIGAGPSGLSCAYFLAQAGFDVEVFEQKEKSGGMMSAAIPKFRLSDEAINFDMKKIEKLGVKINYNQKITSEKFAELRKTSDYIYIAAGAQKAVELNIFGKKCEGYINDPLQFLFDVKIGKIQNTGKKIVITGGGNTAMDVARTVYRLSGKTGKVTIIYRRTIKEMPAEYKEIKDVKDEGIEILELVSPVKINSKNGKLISITCRRMKLGNKDLSGRARPVEIPNSDFELEANTFIPAIGQKLAIDFTDNKLLKTKSGTYETQIENVFIGGDALRNASTLIKAVGDGRKAAQEIINKREINFNTRRNNINKNLRKEQNINDLMFKKSCRSAAVKISETDLSDRKNFNIVRPVLTKNEAVTEASRCLLCDEVCNICTTLCPNLALQYYEVKPENFNLLKIKMQNSNLMIVGSETFEIKQKYQIIHFADWCNKCANCETFCPTSGAPYKEKPHLYFSKTAFEKEKDGYFLEKTSEGNILFFKDKNEKVSLLEKENDYFYKTRNAELILDKQDFSIKDVKIFNDNFEMSLMKVAEMSIILQGKFL